MGRCRYALLAAQALSILILSAIAVSAFYPGVCVTGVETAEFEGRTYVNARHRMLMWNPLGECAATAYTP